MLVSTKKIKYQHCGPTPQVILRNITKKKKKKRIILTPVIWLSWFNVHIFEFSSLFTQYTFRTLSVQNNVSSEYYSEKYPKATYNTSSWQVVRTAIQQLVTLLKHSDTTTRVIKTYKQTTDQICIPLADCSLEITCNG